MEEIAPPPALLGTEPDDPRLDLALEAALGPEPPLALGPPACSDVDERLEKATDALLEEVRRVEEQACAAADRAERERRRRRRLLAGLGGLAMLACVIGLWGRSQLLRADAETLRANSETVRADEGWNRAQSEETRAETGWSLARAETTRADEGWAEAERERARADAEQARANEGWSLAEAETARANEGWSLAEAETARANEGWSLAEAEAARADEGWSSAEAETARAAELARAEAARTLEVRVLTALRAAALGRGEGDFAASLEQLEVAKGFLESELATSDLLALVVAERAELERAVVEDQEARSRAALGSEAIARLEAALARAEIDGSSDSERAELIATAFSEAGLDPLAADAAGAVEALATTGRGSELAGGLLVWARAEAALGRTERCAELVSRALRLADGPIARGEAARALLAAGQPAAAAEHLEELCALVPTSRGARELLAGARFGAGDAAGAAEALRGALELGPLPPADEAALRGRLGRALRRAGDLPQAESELKSAAELAPDLAWVVLELAATRLARGDASGALAAVRSLVP